MADPKHRTSYDPTRAARDTTTYRRRPAPERMPWWFAMVLGAALVVLVWLVHGWLTDATPPGMTRTCENGQVVYYQGDRLVRVSDDECFD